MLAPAAALFELAFLRFLEREAREEAVRTLEDVTQRVHGEYERKLAALEQQLSKASGSQVAQVDPEHLVALENTPGVHNMVVCTLCSCYPWPVLGLPPVWYKSAPYRARAVADPHGVLKEFGTELKEDIEIRVWDSTSEVRFLVLPARPEGTEGWSEEELAALVTRNAMIGVETAKSPKDLGRN